MIRGSLLSAWFSWFVIFMTKELGPVLKLCVLVGCFVFVLRFGNFDRSKSTSRSLEGPSRSDFRSIKLAKIP
jgi:hypothetical protein